MANVTELNLTTKTTNVLENLGIETVEELETMRDENSWNKGLGKKCINEIIKEFSYL